MSKMYRCVDMIHLFDYLFIVLEEGSINKAALRLRMGQPTLSRQMKSLENEIGGRLLERGANGVLPTALCHRVIEKMRPVLNSYKEGLSTLRHEAKGAKSEIRVGYLISSAQPVVIPTLRLLRETHPEVKVKLFDMSPREQIDALNQGELDIALTGQEGEIAAQEFYSRKLGSYGVCAALSTSDALSERESIEMKELAMHSFIGADEEQVPGRNEWMSSLAKLGGFQPKFLTVTDGITHVLSLVDAESAVTMLPDYFVTEFQHPGVCFVPISDSKAAWDFIILWQRGKVVPAMNAFINALAETVEGKLTND